MRIHRLYRSYSGEGRRWLKERPSTLPVYRSESGIAWKRDREILRHSLTVTAISIVISIVIGSILVLNIHLAAFLIIAIPILMLAGEVVDLLIWGKEGLSVDIHPDALWVPTVAYSVVTWHIVPFEEVRGVERSNNKLTVLMKESTERIPLDVRWLGEEGLRILMEGIWGSHDLGGTPRLVLYDGQGR